jgi:hypothetical protein
MWGIIALIKRKIDFKKNILTGKIFIGIISSIAILFPVLAINKCTIFTNENIISKKEFPWRKSIYTFDQIREVNVSQFSGLHYNKVNYLLVTSDGKKFDLTSDNFNIRFISDIESNLNDTIPHFITRDALSKLPEGISSLAQWKVIDQ